MTETNKSENKTKLRGLGLSETEALAKDLGQPAFRGRQLFRWINKGITDFREMSDLPEVFVRKLEEKCTAGSLELMDHQVSAKDGTEKFLFGLGDGNAVESVLMRYKYGSTACISSQAGCRMGCAFCASGINGLNRSLTPGEMLSQIMDIERYASSPVSISHVVIMGTGEPFDNYDGTSGFLRLIHDEKGRNMSSRNITVSTCGLVPGIRRFADEFPQVNLAVSLHAPDQETRERIMPVSRAYDMDELMAACEEYTEKTHRRITFEYALIRGVNDSDVSAARLANMLRGMLCHVNLIPLNKVGETGLDGSGRKRAREFAELLEKRGIPATVRRELGSDIDGACGQLRLKRG
ncbi:MAG: 23S rRNA (adenine(2503)-C(2))-methyltransferase RlmN [Eubacterium sp.]|nr:23S rRNA (adenine(2503)-C(2))-methyltransferase RlmN [Eubacterium sp.]